MSKGEFDALDALAFPIFAVGIAIEGGIFPTGFPELGGLNPAQSWFVLGANSTAAEPVTYAFVMAVFAFTVTVVSNKYPIREGSEAVWTAINFYTVIVTYILLFSLQFVPLFDVLFTQTFGKWVATTVLTFGYTSVSYLG